jgi:hypothetical protein
VQGMLPARAPHRERQAAGARRTACPRLRRRQRMQLRAEEVDSEIPILWDPQNTFADADEHGRL